MKFKMKSFVLMLFLFYLNIQKAFLIERLQNIEFVPPPTIKYKHTIIEELNYCIEICKECFSEGDDFAWQMVKV